MKDKLIELFNACNKCGTLSYRACNIEIEDKELGFVNIVADLGFVNIVADAGERIYQFELCNPVYKPQFLGMPGKGRSAFKIYDCMIEDYRVIVFDRKRAECEVVGNLIGY